MNNIEPQGHTEQTTDLAFHASQQNGDPSAFHATAGTTVETVPVQPGSTSQDSGGAAGSETTTPFDGTMPYSNARKAPIAYGSVQAGKPLVKPPATPLAIISLASGIVGLCLSFLVFISWIVGILALVFSLAGMVTGIFALKFHFSEPARCGGKGIAIAGLICGVCGLVLALFLFIIIGLAKGLMDVFSGPIVPRRYNSPRYYQSIFAPAAASTIFY